MSTTTKSAITLRPAPHRKAICECEMPYDVLLHGQVFGELYFNLRGYRGYLPTPDGKKLDIGEKTLAAYKREIAVLNREFRNASAADASCSRQGLVTPHVLRAGQG